MGLKAPWDPSRLTQKSDWPNLFQSLSFTERQTKVLTAILGFFRKNGQPIDFYPLTKHGSSSRFWRKCFVSTYTLRRFFEKLAREGVCSYRYAWDALHCLIQCGFIEADVWAPVQGRKVRGYCFSDRALRYFNSAARVMPKLWEGRR